MSIQLSTIYKIELIKLIKRRDWLVLLALVGISILFGAAVLSDSYSAVTNQSVVYWMCTQILNSSILFITPMIFAFISTRILASEIEEGSLLIYTIRLRDRRKIYLGKSLAAMAFATITFFLTCLINIMVYYIFVCRNSEIASGEFLGNNSAALVLVMIAIYLISFILITQLSLWLSVYFRSTSIIGIVFLLVLVLHNTYKIPYLKYLNPWYYVLNMSNDVISTTNQVSLNYRENLNLFFIIILITVGLTTFFNFMGIKRFRARDL